jgi:Family of unknown function (DUF6516)
MKATLLQKERIKLGENRFAEIVVWQVPQPVPGSAHSFKYRMALVVNEVCVLRYDNEAGKGGHKHSGGIEVSYAFSTLDQLVEDFWADVATF